MTKRKRNALADPPKGKPKRPKPTRRIKDPLTKKERSSAIAEFNYRDRVKRMRGIFGDQFKAKDGYDLRSFKSWTPAKKAKVTKYFRVIAPRITGPFVKKYYRRQDHLDQAIDESQQEEFLKGQTAAVFSVDAPGETIGVKFVKGRAKITRQGLEQISLRFDRAAFLDDPDTEIERVLDLTDSNVFRIITGANMQNRTLTRAQVKDEIFRLIMDYGADKVATGSHPYQEWLNGIVAYPGTTKQIQTKLDKQIEKHAKISGERRVQHNRDRAKRARTYTRRELITGRK